MTATGPTAEVRSTLHLFDVPWGRKLVDEAPRYKALGREFAQHESVAHKRGEYARGDVTTNTVWQPAMLSSDEPEGRWPRNP